MTATAEITHPVWCDREACGEERRQGELLTLYHRSAERVWRSGDADVTV